MIRSARACVHAGGGTARAARRLFILLTSQRIMSRYYDVYFIGGIIYTIHFETNRDQVTQKLDLIYEIQTIEVIFYVLTLLYLNAF